MQIHKKPLLLTIFVISISIALGSQSAFAFTITQIIGPAGDGIHPLTFPMGIATDSSGNVFVSGYDSHNAFKITPSGTITQIIDSSGDGSHPLIDVYGITTDSSGNVFVAGETSSDTFKITPSGTITQIIDSSGDGIHPLDFPHDIVTDLSGNVFVPGEHTDNAFKITRQTPAPTIHDLIRLGNSFGANTNVLKNINLNNHNSACGKLGAFLNQVNANHHLTASQKTQLIQDANAIKASIHC